MKEMNIPNFAEPGGSSNLPRRLLSNLRQLLEKRPSDSHFSSAHDEYNLKLQEIYTELLTSYPQFAIAHKLELEMWNILYKTQIDTLQKALLNRNPDSTSGLQRSPIEVKLRFVLLLDRAAGLYLTLIHRLVQSLPEHSWPKPLISSITSQALPMGFFNLNQIGSSSGRFDLDLATFHVLPGGFAHVPGRSPLLDAAMGNVKTTSAPRILSRGDRLPTETHGSDTNVSDKTDDMADALSTCSLDDESAISYMVQHCLVHLGDVARYRRYPSVAIGYYLWAWVVHPDSGHPYNQLAILESSKGSKKRSELCLYYYIRAVACAFPFPSAHTNMKSLLTSELVSAPDDTIKSAWSAIDIQRLLVRLYAAVHTGTDSAKLINLATTFASAASQSDGIVSDSDGRWLTRLAVVHLYFLTEHFKEPSELPVQHYKPARTVLLFITVYWFELIANQFVALNDLETEAKATNLLAVLIPLLLWLRSHCSSNHSASLDAAFRNCSPPFSESVVSFFNELLNSSDGAPSTVDPQLDWPTVFNLPELTQLQGFQPLGIPTRRQLAKANQPPFLSPFPVSSYYQSLFSGTPCSPLPDEWETGFHSNSLNHRRIKFLLDSLRCVAHHVPALISWSESDSGSFRRVNRSVPVLSELILISPPKCEQVLELPNHTAPTDEVVQVEQSQRTDESSGQPHEKSSVSSDHESQDSSASAMASSQSSGTVASSTAVTGPSAGGLIVNAELAKFIQEQASQVAARQQRAELSARELDDPSSKLAKDASIHPIKSRLGLGAAAFRRDLPPRFARRLQAELLEREAMEQRLGRLGSPDANYCNGVDILNLHQPAPLARKESEAPFELDSLLSATDTNNTIDRGDHETSFLHAASSPALTSLLPNASLWNNNTCHLPPVSLMTQHPPFHITTGIQFSAPRAPYTTETTMPPFPAHDFHMKAQHEPYPSVSLSSHHPYSLGMPLPPYYNPPSEQAAGVLNGTRMTLSHSFNGLPHTEQSGSGYDVPSHLNYVSELQNATHGARSTATVDQPFVYTSVP